MVFRELPGSSLGSIVGRSESGWVLAADYRGLAARRYIGKSPFVQLICTVAGACRAREVPLP